jgi:DNA (cytosine-5)-methyltransferase 1
VTYPAGHSKSPWDGNRILRQCLTTGGAGKYNHHPSGKRGLTVREYAVLQSYPLDHVFQGRRTQQIKQIGNSVPCRAASVLFSSIVKELIKADNIIEPAIVIDSDDEVIVLDD